MRKNGFTIVELLVAAAIVGILMSIISIYFSQQAKVTRQTQARQEVNIKARMVAEMIVQDLQVAGSSVVFDGAASKTMQLGCSAGGEKKCIGKGGSAGTTVHVVYATSLRPDEQPCRRVDYRINSLKTLQRLEQGKSVADCAQVQTEPAASIFNPTALASNITKLEIKYICADDPAPTPDPATCYGRDSFPRQAIVEVVARADDLDTITTTVELTTALPNLRY